MRRIGFFFDLASPYSYLAHTQMRRIREETGAEIELRPVLVGAVFEAAGMRAPATTPAKRRYQRTDAWRWAERYGVPFSHLDPFPFRSVDAMRAAIWLGARAGQEAPPRHATIDQRGGDE